MARCGKELNVEEDLDALTKMMGSKGPKSFNGKQLNALPEKEKKEGDWWYRARVTEV